jgi:hypothetical protein
VWCQYRSLKATGITACSVGCNLSQFPCCKLSWSQLVSYYTRCRAPLASLGVAIAIGLRTQLGTPSGLAGGAYICALTQRLLSESSHALASALAAMHVLGSTSLAGVLVQPAWLNQHMARCCVACLLGGHSVHFYGAEARSGVGLGLWGDWD